MNQDRDKTKEPSREYRTRVSEGGESERNRGEKGGKRIPLPVRILVWIGLLGIFFGLGYFFAGMGLRFLNDFGFGKSENLVENSEEAQRLLASSQEEIRVHRKEYTLYTLQNGQLVRSVIQIAPGILEEDMVTVLEKVLEPLRVASGVQQPLRVLHVFRGGDMLYIDMNSSFVTALKTVGTKNAALLMTGLVRSMVENFSPAEKIRFLLDGKVAKVKEPLDLTVSWTLAPAS